MKVIYKYTLTQEVQDISLPILSKIVHVDSQNENITLWIKQDTEQTSIQRVTFYLVGTGQPVPDFTHHCGTVLIGPYVWHIFADARTLILP